MIHIKVNKNLYPATIDGQMTDYQWDNRESKSITLAMSHAEAEALLPDNTPWSIVMTTQTQKLDENGQLILDEDGNPVMEEKTDEWDNSEFALSGPIIDHRDGTVSIKMGKPTDLEDAMELLLGGETA